jgi:hypothetical protein
VRSSEGPRLLHRQVRVVPPRSDEAEFLERLCVSKPLDGLRLVQTADVNSPRDCFSRRPTTWRSALPLSIVDAGYEQSRCGTALRGQPCFFMMRLRNLAAATLSGVGPLRETGGGATAGPGSDSPRPTFWVGCAGFFSLAECNEAIALVMRRMNDRPMRNLGLSRRSARESRARRPQRLARRRVIHCPAFPRPRVHSGSAEMR